MLALGVRPAPTMALAGGALVGIAVILLVAYRGATILGGDLSQAAEQTPLTEALAFTSEAAEGNEFLYHVAMIETVDQVGRHGWGERFVWYFLIHPVPRLLWRGKPYGGPSGGVSVLDMYKVMGWMRAPGAAMGNVASWYREWGWFSLFAWFLMGVLFASVYRSATSGGSVLSYVAYVLIVAGSLHLVAQGELAMVEPFLLSFGPTALLLRAFAWPPRKARRAGGHSEHVIRDLTVPCGDQRRYILAPRKEP